MQFEHRDDGEYRIHAGSLEPRAGHGHLAAVIVTRSRDGKIDAREVYRDMEVSGGHRWETSDEALRHALMLGVRAVAAERQRTPAPTVPTL
jgi:hypothetical protein